MSHLHFLPLKVSSWYISFQNRAIDCLNADGGVFEAARRHRPRLDNEEAAIREAREVEREAERAASRLTRSQRVTRRAVFQHHGLV